MLRATETHSQAAGKGVNISRAAVAAGIPTIAVLPAAADDPYVLELLGAGIDCRPEPPAGDVRLNVTITEPDGTTTKINSPGATATPEVLDRLRAAVQQRARQAQWVVLAGSLPPGRPGRVVRHPRRRPAGRTGPRRRRHLRRPAGGHRRPPRPGRARPAQAQRRGARRADRRRRRRHRGRPGRSRRRGRGARRARHRRRPRDAGRSAARCSSPPRAPGTPPRRPPP